MEKIECNRTVRVQEEKPKTGWNQWNGIPRILTMLSLDGFPPLPLRERSREEATRRELNLFEPVRPYEI